MCERQTGPLEKIRGDHIERYLWAASGLPQHILDAACGSGYGSSILVSRGHTVTGVDIEPDAISEAIRRWDGPGIERFIRGDLMQAPWGSTRFDRVVSFETIEHLDDPGAALVLFREAAPRLLVSVPNEEVTPFCDKNFAGDQYPHKRHFTPAELEALLTDSGWEISWRGSQANKQASVKQGTSGMFLVYDCRRYGG